MKCPKCGKELLKGEVRSRREIEWFDADNKKGIRVSSKLFAISKAEAERCEDCKIIVFCEIP